MIHSYGMGFWIVVIEAGDGDAEYVAKVRGLWVWTHHVPKYTYVHAR